MTEDSADKQTIAACATRAEAEPVAYAPSSQRLTELARRVAANLHAKLVEVNEDKKLTRRIPSEKQISDWIDQCKKLDRAVHH